MKTTLFALAVLAIAAGSAKAQCYPIPAGPPPGDQKPWAWQGKIWNWNGFQYVPDDHPVYNHPGWGGGPGCGPGPGRRFRRNVPLGRSGHIRYVWHNC